MNSLARVPTSAEPVPAPISLSSSVRTGWEGDDLEGWQPGVAIDLDVSFRLLELDADRRRSSVRHATTPLPAPGALSLHELYELLVSAVALPDAAAAAAQKLLQPADQVTGLLACWIVWSGVELDRVIDLSRLPRINNPVTTTEQSLFRQLPLDAERPELASEPMRRQLAKCLIRELLEHGGWREVEDEISGWSE